jgi:L-malate glycosyltransferase
MTVTEAGSGRQPKILHLIPSLDIGGTEGQLVQFLQRSSNPSAHRVAVFYAPGALASRLANPPIVLGAVCPRLRDAIQLLNVARRLRRVVRELRVDLVHAHLGLSEVLAVAVPRSVLVVSSRRGRNVGFQSNAALKLIEGLGHRRADIMICNTRHWAELSKRDDLWTPPTRVIYNAIDPSEHPVAPMPSGDQPSIAVIANLHPYKRHELFFQAFRLLLGRLPTARVTLVGDGARRPILERLASRLRIAEQVSFAGEVADPRPIVGRSHVVALTSEHEGFPNALLEAMAQGRPVVATGVGGVPELVRDGVDGLLTSSDPDDIAARLHSVLVDAALRERLGGSARERASTFTWDRLVRETESVYSDVLARRR